MANTEQEQNQDTMEDVEMGSGNTQEMNDNDAGNVGSDGSRRHALLVGGVSGILAGITYVIGFLIFGLKLRDLFDEDKLTAVERVEFLKDNEAVFYVANILVYIVNGFLQIVMSCALYQRLHQEYERNNIYVNVALVVGCFWGTLVVVAGMIGNGGASVVIDMYESGEDPQQAATIWKTIDAVYTDGIGGGNEIIGAVWIVAVSVLSLCACGPGAPLPKPVNILGLIAGMAGAVTIVPGLADEAASVFGIAMTVWYVLAGSWLVREASLDSSKQEGSKQASSTNGGLGKRGRRSGDNNSRTVIMGGGATIAA